MFYPVFGWGSFCPSFVSSVLFVCWFVLVICLVYTMSLNCQFVIVPSVFSNVYLYYLLLRPSLCKRYDFYLYIYVATPDQCIHMEYIPEPGVLMEHRIYRNSNNITHFLKYMDLSVYLHLSVIY